jgi:hypothetical protein
MGDVLLITQEKETSLARGGLKRWLDAELIVLEELDGEPSLSDIGLSVATALGPVTFTGWPERHQPPKDEVVTPPPTMRDEVIIPPPAGPAEVAVPDVTLPAIPVTEADWVLVIARSPKLETIPPLASVDEGESLTSYAERILAPAGVTLGSLAHDLPTLTSLTPHADGAGWSEFLTAAGVIKSPPTP